MSLDNLYLEETQLYINNLANLEEQEFNNLLAIYPILKDFLYIEEIFERRCRKMFDYQVIPYRNELKWRDFYYRLIDLMPKILTQAGTVANRLCRYSKFMELKICMEVYKIYPTVDGANALANLGELSYLQYLETFNIYPNSIGANDAAVNACLLVLDWLKQRDIHVTNGAIIGAIQVNNTAFLSWYFAIYNRLPENINACEIAIINNSLISLQFLLRHGYMIPANSVELCKTYQADDILKWLLSNE